MTAHSILDQSDYLQQSLFELIFRAYQFDEQSQAIKREKSALEGFDND